MDVVRVRCDDCVTTASGTGRYRCVDDVAGPRPSADGTYSQRLIAVERGHLHTVIAEQQVQPMLPRIRSPNLG